MWPEVHGVYGNVLTGHRLATFPDFLSLAKRRGLRTYAGLTWAPLATTSHGGPVFADPTQLSYADGEAFGHAEADQLVTDEAAHALKTGDRPRDPARAAAGAPPPGGRASLARAWEERGRHRRLLPRLLHAHPDRVDTRPGHRHRAVARGQRGARSVPRRAGHVAAAGLRVRRGPRRGRDATVIVS